MRTSRRSLVLSIVASALVVPAFAQQTPVRDPQALAILSQTLSAGGGMAQVRAIQDFTATGAITYFWAGDEVQGNVTLRGRGPWQFRLDANLPNGVRSWAVNNGSGSLREPSGTTTSIPFHNAVNFGSLTFPLAHLAAALQEPSMSISYAGIVTTGGRQAHQIRVRQVFNSQSDANDAVGKLTARDYFIDVATFQILGTLDMVHPQRDPADNHAHEIQFSDYRLANGILVPFSITERVAGQRTWNIQLDRISFNVGLRDTDFQF